MSTIPLIALALTLAQPAPEGAKPLDWKTLEAPLLADHVQLTFPERFQKAGEAYFSHDGHWIIFQATERKASDGSLIDASAPYAMYVAKVKWGGESGGEGSRIVGLEDPFVISPPDSANTCGYFHPTDAGRVIFGSTIGKPAPEEESGGYQRGTSRYRWSMPKEMEVVTRIVEPVYWSLRGPKVTEEVTFNDADLRATPLFEDANHYDAECAYSPDGRFIVYATTNAPDERPDLWVYDTTTKKQTPLVTKEGYDGGPFFSPDGKRLCYRSDREGNNLLQLFVAELAFDSSGAITGVRRETQLTSNEHVNWGPFWHPSGAFLMYATSEVGHTNYEVFAIEVPPASDIALRSPSDLKRTRVTNADGFDGLPVFDPTGRWMMWTSQRGPLASGEQRPTSQIWAARLKLDAIEPLLRGSAPEVSP